jgi:hypothetical protein
VTQKRRRHYVRASRSPTHVGTTAVGSPFEQSRAASQPPSLYCTVNVTTSACVAPPAAEAVTVICDVPKLVGVASVTRVDPGELASADVAVTVTVAGLGTTAGVVYSPVPSTWPFAPPPVTAHVTVWLVEPFTVALNCCCVTPAGHELPASLANKVADPGLAVTVIGGGVVVPPTPPQESKATTQESGKIRNERSRSHWHPHRGDSGCPTQALLGWVSGGG